jgi:hypothetical protein
MDRRRWLDVVSSRTVHLAPIPASLEKFLTRFQDFYGAYRNEATPKAVIAAMAAHHLWRGFIPSVTATDASLDS